LERAEIQLSADEKQRVKLMKEAEIGRLTSSL